MERHTGTGGDRERIGSDRERHRDRERWGDTLRERERYGEIGKDMEI